MSAMINRMSGRSRALMIGGVLAVLCVTYWYKTQSGPNAASGSVEPSGQAGEAGPRVAADVRFRAPAELRRDPFSSNIVFPPRPDPESLKVPEPPPVVEQPDPQQVALDAARRDLRLSAIFMSQNPVAIINGVAYHAGDSVQGFLIKRISARSVVLERDGARVLVSVP